MSQNLNEWLSRDLCGRIHVSCFRAIRMVVSYMLPVTFCVSAALSHHVIKTEPLLLITINHHIVGETSSRLYYNAALNDGSFKCRRNDLAVCCRATIPQTYRYSKIPSHNSFFFNRNMKIVVCHHCLKSFTLIG